MAIKDQVIKLVDGDQTQIRATVAQRGAKGAQTVEIVDDLGNQITFFPAGLSIPEHDDIELSYTGDDITEIIYRKEGIRVATLNLTYSGSNLIRIVKS